MSECLSNTFNSRVKIFVESHCTEGNKERKMFAVPFKVSPPILIITLVHSAAVE
jgi:hypothetical protein